MKILFQNHDEEIWGGASHQMSMLMDGLKGLGYYTKFSMSDNLGDHDLIFVNHINLKGRVRYDNCPKPMITKCMWQTYDPRVDNSRSAALAKKSVKLIVESRREKKAMLDFLKGEMDVSLVEGKISTFKPGVDPVFRRENSAARKRVYTNGWYCHRKGQAEVIKACKDLGLPVTTTGRPSDNRYIGYCHSFGYGDVMGPVDRVELNRIYNESKVYVVSSVYESHSVSMCEAIACGCKIVSSSRHAANDDYDKPGFYVYEWGDFDDLKAKIALAYESTGSQENEFWTADRLVGEYARMIKSLLVKMF